MGDARVAVVGCGYWGKNLVRNFAQVGALRAICDGDERALAAQVAAHPDVKATKSFDAILTDDDIDAVVLATPAALHYEHTKRVLEAGKDVFVEKPLSLQYADGIELVDIAAAGERILMVGHILEYHSAVETLKSLVEAGELGDLWYMYSNRANLGKVRSEENILWSFAPHDISVICSLVGAEPEWVTAVGADYLQEGIVDITTTTMAFAGGQRAHIFVSWLHPSKEQKLVVIGSKKMAVFDDTVREGKLKVYDKGIEWDDGIPVARQTSETTLFLEEYEPMRRECEHFLHCIRTREEPRTGGHSALRVLKVLAASQRSLEAAGEPVALEEVAAGV